MCENLTSFEFLTVCSPDYLSTIPIHIKPAQIKLKHKYSRFPNCPREIPKASPPQPPPPNPKPNLPVVSETSSAHKKEDDAFGDSGLQGHFRSKVQ